MSSPAEIHVKHKPRRIFFRELPQFKLLFSENKNAVHKECIGKTQNKGGKCV